MLVKVYSIPKKRGAMAKKGKAQHEYRNESIFGQKRVYWSYSKCCTYALRLPPATLFLAMPLLKNSVPQSFRCGCGFVSSILDDMVSFPVVSVAESVSKIKSLINEV